MRFGWDGCNRCSPLQFGIRVMTYEHRGDPVKAVSGDVYLWSSEGDE
jgi:hypothetical protein